MITPSFSPTATERVLSKLALDFTTASLDPRVTFTRTTNATNPATYVESTGYITSATDNQPRFDYDPVTKVCKGLLIEESRTNLQKNSTVVVSAWGATRAVLTDNSIISPDGTQNAGILNCNTTSASGAIVQGPQATFASAAIITASCYIKKGYDNFAAVVVYNGSSNGVRFYFNIADKVAGSSAAFGTGWSAISSTVQDAGNGWVRCIMVVQTAGTVGNMQINPSCPADGNISCTANVTYGYPWGAQIEQGAFATSYIPTTSASLTRNADVATITGTNFSSWYNATQGTFEAKFDFIGPAALSSALDQRIFTVHQAAAIGSNNLQCYRTAADGKINVAAINGGSAQVNGAISSTITVANTTYNATFGYKLNLFAASLNADTVFTDNVGTVPVSIDRLIFGSYNDATGKLNGHMKNFNYWPQRLINNEVQSFSKI